MMEKQNPYLTALAEQLDRVVTRSPSPVMIWLAPVVRAVSGESLTMEYAVREEMTNPVKGLHGGITAAIMDDMIGATILCSGAEYFYTTINNVIDYFATARTGDMLTGTTRIIKPGRKIMHVQCELWNLRKNRLIARGHSNNLITPVPVPPF